MKSLGPSEIKKALTHAPLDKASRLVREKRVYNLHPVGESWSACVLADNNLPATTVARDDGKRLHWDCDCAAAEPCLHLWALVARLHQDEHIYQSPLRAALSAGAKPAASRGAASADGPDLFGELDGQPSLFGDALAPPRPRTAAHPAAANETPSRDTPGHHSAKRPSSPIEAEDSLFAQDIATGAPLPATAPDQPGALTPAAVSAGAPAALPPKAASGKSTERPELIVFLLRLQAMNRPDLWVEKLNLHLSPSQASAQQAAMVYHDSTRQLEELVDALALRVEQSAEHQLSLGSAIADLLAVHQSLASTPKLPLPRLSFTTPNRALGFRALDSVVMRPVLVRTTPEGKGRYQIQFELFSGDASLATVPASALACEGATVYALLKGEDILAWRQGDRPLASLIARVRAMPGPFSALDLQMLRTWMAERQVSSARLPEIGHERFAYKDVQPRAVLSLQAGLHRIEIFLTFAYDGQEVAFHADSENLTRELPDGLTIVMPRQRASESRLHHGLRELLSDSTQYERGLYAEMIGARTVPDISVVGELAEFITERGRMLIAAGYDLRMEGRPIKAGGSLSFRAESGLDWFGFRAGWKDDGGEAAAGETGLDGRRESTDPYELPGGGHGVGTLDLVVDEHLDRYGIAGAGKGQAGESWIILGQRDIDRLKLLRNLGMDQSGLLETSPVNISLIDSLYADIENKDEINVQRSRELSRTLGEFSAHQHAADETDAGHPEDGPPPQAVDNSAALAHLGQLLPQPLGLQATLRSYQLVGYNWLAYLHEQKLGGCLADDMGLGKTVQTIALLQRLKEQGQLGPSLLIAPVVTLPNWEDELARFAPTLRFKRHSGGDRAKSVDELLGKTRNARGQPGVEGEDPGGRVAPGGDGQILPLEELAMGVASDSGDVPEDLATPGSGSGSPQSADRGRLRSEGEGRGEATPGVYRKVHEDGSDPLTEAIGAQAASVDIILVSYQTLRNDLDLFVQHQWDYAILDEAHYIKNSGSQIFKAIRVLPAKHRLSLTGTPIENSTMELWSQFSFLNPGLLGSRRHFASEVAMPIERDGSEAAAAILRDTIAPFILRRRKQDVLADLPPKDEILNWCEMAHDQARLYEEHCALYRDQIAGVLDSKGVEGSRMDIFRALLRLRQIAINPAMIKHAPRDSYGDPDEDQSASSPYAHISSAKMESLRMIMDESLQENHKMLVFSQFVTALKLISGELDRDGRRHALLTGQTVDRRTVVKDFQTDEELRIFLLSLKAGGVGINLTSADYVVLFDPWWNPAAERQAVDRAHRIGQKRPVIVYKFITRGTIEEKILALQHKKHRLVGSLLVGESGEDALLSGMDESAVMDLFK